MSELVVCRQRPPSGFDILDALPNEILSAIFAQVYHLEPTVVGSSLVVIELLNPRHSSQTQATGCFNDPLYTSELGNVPVHGAILASINQIIHDDVLNHPNLDLRKVNLEQLLWPILQSTWPNIRLQALLAFMRQVTVKDPATEARLWQYVYDLGMTFRSWRRSNCQPAPARLNSMTALNHHFKDHLSAMKFLDANMATATKIRSMTLDCTHSSSGSSSSIVKPISSVLQYFSWVNNRSDVFFTAHLQHPSNGDEWTSNVVRLRHCFSNSSVPAGRYLLVGTVTLQVISLAETLDAKSWLSKLSLFSSSDYLSANPDKENEIQALRSRIISYFTSYPRRAMLPADWPPKHIEWTIKLQDEGADHMNVLKFFGCTTETPTLFEAVWVANA